MLVSSNPLANLLPSSLFFAKLFMTIFALVATLFVFCYSATRVSK